MEKDKKAPKELYFEIEIPEGVQVKKEDYNIIVEGPQGKVEKVLRHTMIDIIIESNLIKIKPKKQSRREKWRADKNTGYTQVWEEKIAKQRQKEAKSDHKRSASWRT